MAKRLNALKARKNFGELLEETYYRGHQYIIERSGRPMAAVIPVWQLEEWEKRRGRLFEMVEALWDENREVKPETIEEEVAEAIRLTRAKHARRGS